MPFTEITGDDLLTAVYERLGDHLGNTFWRQDEVIRFTNESLRLWNLLTGLWRDAIPMGEGAPPTTAAAQVFYRLPSNVIYGLRMECNGVTMEPTNLFDLDFGQPNWQAERCGPTDQPRMWAPVGIGLIAIWPSSFNGGESLTVEGVVPAPQLIGNPSNLGNPLDLPKEDMADIAAYAAHVMRVKEGGQEFQSSIEQLKLFLKGAGQRNSILMQSAKYRQWMGITDRQKRPIRTVVERVGAR